MIKLLKNLSKKDRFIILVIAALVIFSVFLDLRMPEYMSKITRLVQTEDTTMKDILTAGTHMLLCAVGSMLTIIVIGYFSSLLSANFSKVVRRKIFVKVESFGLAEIKKFKTSSLITRTTNDVTQIEMLIALGRLALIKAPIMAVWAITKIINKSYRRLI